MNGKSKSLNVILLFIILYVLKAGQEIFLPFVVALFLWCLIYILTTKYNDFFTETLKLSEWPKIISRVFAIITISAVIYFIVIGIKSNINQVVSTFDFYQKNMTGVVENIQNYLGIQNKITLDNLIKDINIPKLINSVIQGFASFLSSSLMVFVYLLFILLEEKSFTKKFPLLFSSKQKEKEISNIMKKIYSKIEVYVSVKLFTSFLTAILVYPIMKFVNLDFALFWAILTFLLNFIPTVGSIISTIFPLLLALLQFNGDLIAFSIVSVGTIAVQLIIGNIVDPKIMGKRLNLSPLVLILSLVIWGSIWGIVGMFLCVPIMIILTIILLQIPSTKKFAILLTEEGNSF